MNSGEHFPIFKTSDVFLFEEVFFELLFMKYPSTENCLKICRELQKILLVEMEDQPIVLKATTDKIELINTSLKGSGSYEYFDLVRGVSQAKSSIQFKGFEIPKSELIRFQKRQTLRQRSEYIASLNKNLEERNAKISDLIGAKNYLMNFIVHEIRNPLNTIIGYSNILRDSPEALPIEEAVEVFQRQSMDIKRLVDEVLDFSKLETNKLQVKNEKINIVEFSKDFAKSSEMIVKAKKLKWNFNSNKDIGEHTYIYADSFRLKQILNNFLSNSIKFTDEGSISFNVDLKKDSGVVLSISDTGKGFDPEFKEKIFGEFSQESAEVSKKFGGSGLGLNIAQSLANLMNASLDADSELGKGASFKIHIPLISSQNEVKTSNIGT